LCDILRDMLHQWHGTIDLIQRALAEDAAMADPTTALLPSHLTGRSVMVAKEPGVVAGIDVALEVFRQMDSSVHYETLVPDGERVEPSEELAVIEGRIQGILRAERTALNFVQRMSGIATATNSFVQAVADLNTTIIDTRKTLPGWRLLDKYAVRTGGGHNHRMNLSDGVLIKDNHIVAMGTLGVGLTDLIHRARAQAPHMIRIEVEVESLEQLREALDGDPDILLLDNMDIETMRQAVKLCKGRALTEASGGVTLETVRAIAETGVDLVSTGAITHSVKALDISLDTTPNPST
jgi:nicotinate-nucleotide pyrophosphorylase (carboxylating)